jgi:hypothetical protein
MKDHREIPLTQGQVAIVDAADYEWLMQWKWQALWAKCTQSYYAARHTCIGGKDRHPRMHREILGLAYGDKREGDHINRNTLDNRRSNLRIATKAENIRNASKRRDNTSGLTGVRSSKTGRWEARIIFDKRYIHLGTFDTRDEAHAAYCSAATAHHGQFSKARNEWGEVQDETGNTPEQQGGTQ